MISNMPLGDAMNRWEMLSTLIRLAFVSRLALLSGCVLVFGADLLTACGAATISESPQVPGPPGSGGGAGEDGRDRDAQGWTIFNASTDTNQIHVSSSTGVDVAGCGAIGAPCASIAYGIGEARDGFPDWVLLKRGETWNEHDIELISGRGRLEPFLLSTYGDYADPRPLVKTGSSNGINGGGNTRNAVVVGIEFIAQYRDPSDPEYRGMAPATPFGINFWTDTDEVTSGILIEDCKFSFFHNNKFNTFGGIRHGDIWDITLRRNVIVDNWSPDDEHSQGMWVTSAGLEGNSGLFMEENILDHNGWLVQGTSPGTSGDNGQATIYNHNLYFNRVANSTYVRNISIRPSSQHHKTTSTIDADYPGGYMTNVVWDDNFYIDGETVIEVAGNPPFDSIPWTTDVVIQNNVATDLGRSHPTGRTLGWGLQLQSHNNLRVRDNLLVNTLDPTVINTFAVRFDNAYKVNQSIFERNIIHGWGAGADDTAISWREGSEQDANMINLRDNIIQGVGFLVNADEDVDHHAFSGNRWHTTRESASWFDIPSGRTSLAGWNAYSGDTGTAGPVTFVDDTVSIEGYMASIGETATFDTFISLVREQRRGNWRAELMADAINDYFRAGFTVVR